MRESVENIIMAHFGVTPEQLRSAKSDSRNTSDAKHFLWYFLCFVLGYETRSVAEEYNTSRRNVNYAVSMIRDGVQAIPFYAKHCSELTKQLKELNLL